MPDFDVVVAGGSISGLLAAREAARAGGLSVAVLEEDAEIGTPEHCGGLVSMEGVKNLGIIPAVIENSRIKKARILPPSKNNGFEISAERQRVVVLDRRELDKQAALQAQRAGAEIRVKCSVRSAAFDSDRKLCTIKTSEGDLTCRHFVDARGVASIISRNREGVLSSAQYEVYADWIARDTIEVAFDSERYPGFFAWVIPAGDGQGKVGVAGKGINAASALKSYMDSKGIKYSVVRKVYAPIWVSGPAKNFVDDNNNTVYVGDAAGQTKPTTAGGIYTCGMGGILAGRAIAAGDPAGYQPAWESLFKDEFDKMLLARRLLERLDNRAIDDLFAAIPKEKLEEAASTGDFDFHSAALTKMLSAKGAARMAKALLGNEIRRLVDNG